MRRSLTPLLILLSTGLTLASGPQREIPPVAREPNEAIRAWEELKFGMFVHFGMSTYKVDQFGRVPAVSADYAPPDMDVDQWARTARAAGMKYMVLTAKHHYGHALWPSAHSDYTVATSSNRTDVVRLFVDACRKCGLAPGLYYSLGWDRYHQAKRTHAEYEDFVLRQTAELLTGYGPITELWFDIPWDLGSDTGAALSRLYAHCKRLQPDCLILLNQGFVDGSQVNTREPSYIGKILSSTPVPLWPKDLNNGELIFPPPSGHNPHITFQGQRYYIPNEVCTTVGQERWFWGEQDDPRPARQLYEVYRRSVGRNSNLLLNIGPDRNGKLPIEMVRRLKELAMLIRHPALVEDSLLIGGQATASNVYHNEAKRWGPQHAIDMDITVEAGTRWATDNEVKTAWLEVELTGEKTLDHATISERLDSVRQYELQVPDGNGRWKPIYRGTRIGGLGVRIAFPRVTSSRIRLAITDSDGGPTLWDFAAYGPLPASRESGKTDP